MGCRPNYLRASFSWKSSESEGRRFLLGNPAMDLSVLIWQLRSTLLECIVRHQLFKVNDVNIIESDFISLDFPQNKNWPRKNRKLLPPKRTKARKTDLAHLAARLHPPILVYNSGTGFYPLSFLGKWKYITNFILTKIKKIKKNSRCPSKRIFKIFQKRTILGQKKTYDPKFHQNLWKSISLCI